MPCLYQNYITINFILICPNRERYLHLLVNYHFPLHMDLFGPSRVMSFGGSYYALVIVDDYSRYTWTLFLIHKNDAFHAFMRLAKVIQNKKSLKIISIRSDHLKTRILKCFVMNMA